jgi:hypothetical protein
MEPLLIIAAFLWLCLALGLSAWWILGPLGRAAQTRQLPSQFRVADLLCLIFLLQLPLALLQWAGRWARAAHAPTITGFAILALFSLVLLWWFSVECLSEAGVRQTRHRCVFLAGVLPIGLVAAFFVGLLPVVVAGRAGLPLRGLVFAVSLAAAALYASGCFTRYVLRVS